MGPTQTDKRLSLWMALCLCALLAGPSLGVAQSKYDPERSKAVDKAIVDHVTLTRGSRWWPDDPMRNVSPGVSPEEQNRRQHERLRTGDVIAATGEVRGPGGLVRPFTLSAGEGIIGIGVSLDPDGEVDLRPKEVEGLFDFAIGVGIGDRVWAASRTSVLPGQIVNVPLGDGYSVNISLERRAPTPGEQRVNNMVADSMAKAMNEGFPLPPPDGKALPPPIDYSPFTNSVIRQGAQPK